MSLNIKIQAKSESILQSEARFYGVTATAVAKAIIDKVVGGELTRDVLQGVDVASYQTRHRDRAKGADTYHFRGVFRTLKEIQAITGVSSNLIASRIGRGWKLEKAATTAPKIKHRRKLEIEE